MLTKMEVFIRTNQPTTCPICGCRTEVTFESLIEPELVQHHKCLSRECGFEFIEEEDV